MLAEARHPAGPPAPAFVLDHHRMLSVPRSPRSPRTPRSPRLGLASPKTGGGTSSSRPSTLAAAAPVRPVFDFVRTAGGRPLSLPYSVDHAGHHAGLLARPSPPPSLLDSLSLTEDAEHGDQDNSPAASLLDSPRLTPVSSLMDSNSLARVARLRQPALLDGYQSAWQSWDGFAYN
ncbi:hypothetical protein ONE63_010822 [Megalurothrips usitatus]|uniref:Uncharacterized protein n=1 Tax=Megalurothrips usitatus TaxID=439358 RepID=A0AAV7XHY7_9NEOP|nr:hypothetical protein ONE63_010822 [Megalurothrips usitatus]